MKTFGELTREEKIQLFTAWVDGSELESKFSEKDEWTQNDSPSWSLKVRYRIKPTKPSINWDHVHSDYNWLATDKDGNSFLSPQKPQLTENYWMSAFRKSAKIFASFKPGTCAWEESPVERPKK